MDTTNKPIELVYRASITQRTGEAWSNVSLTLETASPSFGVDIPILYPWNLYVAGSVPSGGALRGSSGATRAPPPSAPSPMRFIDSRPESEPPYMEHRAMNVGEKGGDVNATFEVPGLITVPCDGAAHNVTIAKLALDADMSWVCVPRKDTNVHLKAFIQNASDYTLLPGVANFYLDGSYISRSTIGLVSPQSTFDCPLGVDPSIRSTYHPLIKKRVTQSSLFYSKSDSHMFSQRITVQNTKQRAITNLKVVDHIPVSQDQAITVKLLAPALHQPEAGGDNNESSLGKIVKVKDGVSARWDGTDDPEVDDESLGKDGKLNWTCEIPAHSKVDLILSWEVTAPLQTEIVGLSK